MSLDLRQSRLVFSQVIQGYTYLSSSIFGPIYIKHLNNLDLAEIDFWYNHYLNSAIQKGIPTHDEKVKYLIDNDLYNKKDEEKLKDYKNLAKQYENNKSNEYLKSKRDQWNKQLEDLNKDIKDLEHKKNSLIGDCAENFATKKSNELHILASFYRDKLLNIPLFTEESFGELDNDQMGKIYEIFNEYMKNFNSDNLKRISLSGFFQNMLNLSGDDVSKLYGKAIIFLSFYQIDLASLGRYFKNVMQEMGNTIPKDILSEPDKILEYVELNQNYKKMFPDEKEQEGASVVGATKDDLKLLGMTPRSNADLAKTIEKEMGRKTQM